MSTLTSISNPLMQPIHYNGQVYFTSQYFHQMYRRNAEGWGKYGQLKHFNRMIRSIEAYENYIQRNDIIEITWNEAKKITSPDFGPVFESVSYNPLMLINATAQVALTHHLDDAISKEMSVTTNEQVANQSNALPNISDPTLSALIQSLVELDQVKQQQEAIIQKTELLENRVQNVELQHRNGVPQGYISRKQAHHLYGVGLSEEIFHLALAHIGIQSKPYIHRGEDGYEVATHAYKDDDISEGIELFLDNANQVTPKMCESPMLNGKRFRYIKDDVA